MLEGTIRVRRRGAAVIAAALILALTGCDLPGTGSSGTTDGTGGTAVGTADLAPDPSAVVASLAEAPSTSVLAGADAHTRSVEASQELFASAPVVVLAAPEEQLRAASAAVALGVPAIVDGPGAAAEIERLGAEVALVLGAVQDPGIDVVVPADDQALAPLMRVDGASAPVAAADAVAAVAQLDPQTPQLLVPAEAGDEAAATAPVPGASTLASDRDQLPLTAAPTPREGVVVLSSGDPDDLAALGTARAAGAPAVLVPGGDPRASAESVQALAALAPSVVLGLGAEFGDAETLQWRTAAASTGVELPGGGQLVLPDRTYVALYGTPVTSALGVLGEQPIDQTITRAEEMAASYEALIDEPVVPTLEIIATVASADAGADGNYSNELPLDDLRPLIELAGQHGVYVLLDLQPGRTDFVTQAKIYEEFLRLPYVGLALDPEWRLRPDQVHLTHIGRVEISEVNEVVTYLADLTREHDLPQKMLVLHQFQTQMIPDANDVDQTRSEVAVLIHADGQGSQGSKQETWRVLHAHAPDVTYWGWKNFYDEDVPGPLSPEETMTLVDPVPDFISYQ